MHAAANLAKALATIAPSSFIGPVARRVGLAALLTPIKAGARIADLEFLFSSRRRNRFTPSNGPKSLYVGEDENVGSAEVKRIALLGSFAKKTAEPASVFWVQASLPGAVLDLTDAGVLATLGTTDDEVHNPDWKALPSPSPSEMLGTAAFRSGRFAAIKYWSVRMREAGQSGFCLCVFKSRVKAPRSLRFTSAELGLDETWI